MNRDELRELIRGNLDAVVANGHELDPTMTDYEVVDEMIDMTGMPMSISRREAADEVAAWRKDFTSAGTGVL